MIQYRIQCGGNKNWWKLCKTFVCTYHYGIKHKSGFHFHEKTKDKCRLIFVCLCMHIRGTMVLHGWLQTLATSGTWCIQWGIEHQNASTWQRFIQLEPQKSVDLFVILSSPVFYHFSLNSYPLTLVSRHLRGTTAWSFAYVQAYWPSNQILYVKPQNLFDDRLQFQALHVYMYAPAWLRGTCCSSIFILCAQRICKSDISVTNI